MPNLIDMINQKLELYRLEKRYTRRRNRRSTFVSDAVYVDGEYYPANNTTSYSYSNNSSYSANCTAGNESDSGSKSSSQDSNSKASSTIAKDTTGKSSMMSKTKRLSLMDWRRGSVRESKQPEGTRVSVREMKWDGSVRS